MGGLFVLLSLQEFPRSLLPLHDRGRKIVPHPRGLRGHPPPFFFRLPALIDFPEPSPLGGTLILHELGSLFGSLNDVQPRLTAPAPVLVPWVTCQRRDATGIQLHRIRLCFP